MSHHECAQFISDEQRLRILRSVIESYWSDLSDKKVIFDTNRIWCALLPSLSRLLPQARIVCCVRDPAWIIDSMERLVQRNSLLASKLFPKDEDLGNVFTRYDSLLKTGMVGNSIRNLRQAWFSEHADRLIAVRYDSLAERPAEIIRKLYELLDQEPFKHDFDHVEYEEVEFDSRLYIPGLHKVTGRVEAKKRQTILPPELFKQCHNEFWNLKEENPRGVVVL